MGMRHGLLRTSLRYQAIIALKQEDSTVFSFPRNPSDIVKKGPFRSLFLTSYILLTAVSSASMLARIISGSTPAPQERLPSGFFSPT